MTLETDRAVLLRYTRDGKTRRGSGLRIGGTYVLTADHCANGTDHRVVVEGREYTATVAMRSGTSDIDIAALAVRDLPALPPMACARVNTAIAARVEDCVALGFPTWNRRNGIYYRVQADGYVGTGEGADPQRGADGVPRLVFKITTPAIKDRTVGAGDLADPTSQWGGMSGAVIVAGARIIGVVGGHAPDAGVGSLTFTPVAAIDLLPQQAAEELWRCLGVRDPMVLPVFQMQTTLTSYAEPRWAGVQGWPAFGEIELESSRHHRVEPKHRDAARQCFELIGRPVDDHSRTLGECDADRDLDRVNPKYRASLCRSQFHDPDRS